MQSHKCSVGYPGGPTIGANFFVCETLRNTVLHYVIMDNGLFNDMQPTPEYTFSSGEGRFEWCNGNVWCAPNKLIFVYSKSKQ